MTADEIRSRIAQMDYEKRQVTNAPLSTPDILADIVPRIFEAELRNYACVLCGAPISVDKASVEPAKPVEPLCAKCGHPQNLHYHGDGICSASNCGCMQFQYKPVEPPAKSIGERVADAFIQNASEQNTMRFESALGNMTHGIPANQGFVMLLREWLAAHVNREVAELERGHEQAIGDTWKMADQAKERGNDLGRQLAEAKVGWSNEAEALREIQRQLEDARRKAMEAARCGSEWKKVAEAWSNASAISGDTHANVAARKVVRKLHDALAAEGTAP